MRVQPVIDHIKGLGYKVTGGAREYRALRAVPAQLPAGYVVPLGRSTTTLARTGVVHQQHLHSFAVVTMLNDSRAGIGASTDALDDLERALIERLTGWMHPDASTHVIATGAQDISDQLGCFAWATIFSFSSTYRKAVR